MMSFLAVPDAALENGGEQDEQNATDVPFDVTCYFCRNIAA
jgi:hypothetical protein